MNVGDRVARLDYFRHLDEEEHGLLANARCLSEGVDVPTIDGVAFIDPRRSQVDIVQAVGRAIRLAPDKTLGTIVIPVLINPEDDIDMTLGSSEFATVWHVVNALRAHDDELAEELDRARRDLGRSKTTGHRPDKLILDLPADISLEFAKAFDARLVEATASTWEFWFGVLESYVERHGHARVKQHELENGQRLGLWVAFQRSVYREAPSALKARGEKLNPERIRRLQSLPGWQWSTQDAAWEDGLAVLQAFVARMGTALAVQAGYEEDGYPLAEWVKKQRRMYRNDRLSAERVQRLELVSGWTWNKHDAAWEDGYNALLAYVRREGSARHIPKPHTEGGYKLGDWVYIQRQKRRAGRMKAARVQRLSRVPGWRWETLDVGRGNGEVAELDAAQSS
jgi:hypothetical protein